MSPDDDQPLLDPAFGTLHNALVSKDVETLIAGLTDPRHRTTAARRLAKLGATEAAPHITRLLHADDPVARATAAKALGRLGAADAVPSLLDVAKDDPSDVVRSYAIATLGRLHDGRARPLLEFIVANDGNGVLRRSAARSLETIGNVGSVPVLRAAALREPLRRRWCYYRAARRSGKHAA